MRKNIRYLLCFLAALPLMWVLVIGLWFGVPAWKPYLYPNNDIAWVVDLYKRKDAMLEKAEGPRLLLVGGSSVHFGLDATRLSEALHRSVFNYGTHGGMGISYLLDRAGRETRSGDTVVLILEYPLFQQPPFFSLSVFYSSFHDKEYWGRVPPRLWLDYISQFDMHLLWKAFKENIDNWRFAPIGLLPGTYDAKTIDDRGTERGNLVSKVTPAMKARVEDDEQDYAREITGQSLRSIEDFVEMQRARGVTVLAGWSPSLERMENNRPAFGALCARLAEFWKKLDVPVIGACKDFMVDSDSVFDTSFHMNDRGMEIVTGRYIEAIRESNLLK